MFEGAADGVELDLKMLARRPLGPVSSVGGPEVVVMAAEAEA
jgi:hypothetical protein